MSVNSTQYNCKGSGVVTPRGASSTWCLKANGDPRMQTCCSQFGNGTVNVQDECYAWCDIEPGTTNNFHNCLAKGSNDTLYDWGCSVEPSGHSGDKESTSMPAFNAPKNTLSALFCGVLALSVLYI